MTYRAPRFSALTLTLAAALALSACGGGESASFAPGTVPPVTVATPGTPPPVVVVTPETPPRVVVVAPGNLVASVPAATYLAASPERTIYEAINAARTLVGVGLLAQEARLDNAARNHEIYLSLNPDGGPHVEDPLRPGFTGVSPTDRARAVGFAAFSVGENVAVAYSHASCVAGWLSSVSHRVGLLYPVTVVGVGQSVRLWRSNWLPLPACTMNHAAGVTGSVVQLPDGGVFPVYPVPGQTGVPLTSTQRSEPDLGSAGYPSTILLHNAETGLRFKVITLTSASFTGPAGPLPIRVIGGAELVVPVGLALSHDDATAGSVSLLPVAPLVANTTYTAAFAGQITLASGKIVPFNRTVTFATGTATQW